MWLEKLMALTKYRFWEGAGSLAWFSVGCLDDWLAVPAKPMLQNRFGPWVLLQTSSPLGLLHARILEGLSLTNKQAQFVLEHHGQKPEGKSKKDAKDDADLSDSDLSDYQALSDFVEECGNAQDAGEEKGFGKESKKSKIRA